MKIKCAFMDEIENDCFIVYARLGNESFMYHNGPASFAYFTKEQAESLLRKVRLAGEINLEHWWDGCYHRDEYALMEAEYFEG